MGLVTDPRIELAVFGDPQHTLHVFQIERLVEFEPAFSATAPHHGGVELELMEAQNRSLVCGDRLGNAQPRPARRDIVEQALARLVRELKLRRNAQPQPVEAAMARRRGGKCVHAHRNALAQAG